MPNLDAIARAKVGPVRGPFSRQLGSWIKRARSRALTRTSTRKYGEEIWRRVRDSNPRYGFPYAGFQDRCHQPLGQLSGLHRIRVRIAVRTNHKKNVPACALVYISRFPCALCGESKPGGREAGG